MDKLFDVFSENTTVPKCVLDRIDETLEMLEGADSKHYEKRAPYCENVELEAEKTTDKKTTDKETVDRKKVDGKKVLPIVQNGGKIRNAGRQTHRKNWKRSLILSFAAVMAFGATVFAAEKYMGISSFFSNGGSQLSEEAQALIENEPVQQEEGDSILTYTVKEALCDKNSVQIVVEAVAKERGKYFLVGEDSNYDDPVSNLGIDSNQTIEEYAGEKGLTVVRVNAHFEFGEEIGISSASGDFRSQEDDVLLIYSSAAKTNQSSNLTVSCVGTAVLPDAKSVEDVMRTNITFQLEDKSQERTVTYVPKDAENGAITADGKVKIQSVDVEESEVGEYVTIHYMVLEDDSNISLDVINADGNLWKMTSVGGSNETDDAGKEGVWKTMYEKTDLPDEIGIRAYDYENTISYEPVILQKS